MDQNNRVNQKQFLNLISSNNLSWQNIIYDLIKTEQLDPWDIDLAVLAEEYVVVIQQLEETDFLVSSKILFACSLLLRLKSEILVSSYIQDLNDALYGTKEAKRYEMEKIEIDEDELPILSPRTPMARRKKITLQELIKALDHAINTESRRIKKEIKNRQGAKNMLTVLPRNNFVPLKIRINSILKIIKTHLGNGNNYTEFSLVAPSKEEKIASFIPVLHLSNDGKIFLRQTRQFKEIKITSKITEEELKEREIEIGLIEK